MSSAFSVVLGEKYDAEDPLSVENLRSRAHTLIRHTYRRDFPIFNPYSITSDSGWGCMLRSAQTLMANSFLIHYFGRDWRLPSTRSDIINNEKYVNILKWFLDIPGAPHYYGLHHLVQGGIKYSTLPGEWFGPATVSLVLRDLAEIQRKKYDGPITVYVANGDTIYSNEVYKLMDTTEPNKFPDINSEGVLFDPLLNTPPPAVKSPWTTSLLILLPLRLGLDRVNEEYVQELKEIFMDNHFVGILGGWPNHALYFVGYNSHNQLLGLDPHTTYSSADDDSSFPKQEYLSQIHVYDLEKVDFSYLDPSLAIGYLFRSREEFEDWYERVGESIKDQTENDRTPLFFVAKMAPSYHATNMDMDGDSAGGDMDENAIDDEDEDYVVLPDFK